MKTTKEAYRYFAFISYSSNDEKYAKVLQKKIETYRLPTVIHKELNERWEGNFPKRLKPIFRDRTDLPAAPLGTSLLRELEDSRYLIVVCSPRSAQSEWVNREVENFILMGRFQRIIPYIIDGEGNSNDPEKEAFPPILRRNWTLRDYKDLTPEENAERQAKLTEILSEIRDELVGPAIAREGKREARLKVIARMLEVRPDELIQRDKQRVRRLRQTWCASITAFLCLAACLSFWIYDKYYRLHTNYFVDYVERWGVPEGIFPLTEEQTKTRNAHYRILTRAGRVEKLIHANSAGIPVPVSNTELQDRPMIAEYHYHETPASNGKYQLSTVEYKDRNDKVLMARKYTDDLKALDFTQSREQSSEDPFRMLASMTSLEDPFERTSKEKSRISRYSFQYDSNGFVTRCEFKMNNENIPAKDADGVSGFAYELDEYGRVILKKYLFENPEQKATKKGIAKRRYEYDSEGNLEWTTYLNENDEPTFNEQGWKIRKYTYNEKGNCIRRENFANDRKTSSGSHYTYDERGNKTQCEYFGVDGKPCLHKNGYAGWRSTYDERGNETQCEYFGVDGKPCLNKNGYAGWRSTYDERGNETQCEYFGVDGKPCLH
ncbi:MAG: TIR domain-containing protein, partial [Thermoguttaceae bacterium]|nr:TIR domain-containing protein [Thermoguttaceae bacterium]